MNTEEEALTGALDIIAEVISDNAEYRDIIRKIAKDKGVIQTGGVEKQQQSVYKMYYDYKEPIKTIPNHRILAINRGEKEKVLKVDLLFPDEEILSKIKSKIIIENSIEMKEYLEASIEDSYKRLIFPSIEREIRSNLTEKQKQKL